ncbi:MAG: transporter substrate-binding domain-containing protein [Methylobacterium frigidaeris]
MLTRRGMLAVGAAALMPCGRGPAAQGPAARDSTARDSTTQGGATLRLGLLPFGTVSWEAAVIRERGLDAAQGFTLEGVRLAGSDAARIAFQGGQADLIVSDLLWAARLRAEGRPVRFLPYSTSEGALMVPGGSPLGTVADLAGKRLGVAGGALDKNWLLLKARAREADGIDLDRDARPAFGAPPLLMQKLEAGELDAALLYWTFCARLEARGFRRLTSADAIARGFGVAGPVALLGYVFDDAVRVQRGGVLTAFTRASRGAKAALADDESAWAVVRPLMAAEDEPTCAALRREFLDGIPRRPVAEEEQDAGRLIAVLARLGGERLLGAATTLPDGLYWDPDRHG